MYSMFAATGVTTTAAQLNGTVNPNGAATTYHFDYGLTTAYGTSTTGVSAGSGTSDVSASAALSALTPGTTYHYRVVAVNSGASGSTLLAPKSNSRRVPPSSAATSTILAAMRV